MCIRMLRRRIIERTISQYNSRDTTKNDVQKHTDCNVSKCNAKETLFINKAPGGIINARCSLVLFAVTIPPTVMALAALVIFIYRPDLGRGGVLRHWP